MKDLREFIDKATELGELRVIEGAHWDLELGAITFQVARGANPPALLFDKIKDYKSGYRVLTIPCSTDKRLALILGLRVGASRLELVRTLRDKLKQPLELIPPVEVTNAPILQNVYSDDEMDLFRFPTPRWTAFDGGRYIGTGDNVIVRDPDEGWVNVSTHRIQIYDKSTATIFVEPGQHLDIIRKKYWDRGQSCPVAVTCGGDPLLVSIGSTRTPWGVPEYDYAGWWEKKPLEVVKGPTTGLPIPAYAEIALEGEIVSPQVETKMEGPFVEFTGHYMPAAPEAVFRVKRILHRNDPILLGVTSYLGPGVYTWTRAPIMSARVWGEIDRIVPGVRGVWAFDEFGDGRCLVISVKQQYPGHAQQTALAAMGHYSFARRFVIVVDEDVDPSNLNEVLCAMGAKADPATFDIIKGTWCSKLEPLLADPAKQKAKDFTTSTAIIMACKPFNWIEEFPLPVQVSPELLETVKKKWAI